MKYVILAIVVSGLASEAAAQRVTLQGRVRDANGMGVPHVNVIVSSQGRYVTDDSGAFAIRVPAGSVSLELRRLGYQPASAHVSASADTTLDLRMIVAPRELPAEQVTATAIDVLSRRGFYDRMRDADRGLVTGYFVTPEDIEARRPFRTSQMLERVPGVKMLGNGGATAIPVGLNDCRMTIYLDGARLALEKDDTMRGGSALSIQRLRDAERRGPSNKAQVTPEGTLDDLVGITSVTGIEIYPRGTRAPAVFQTLNGTCGIIAIWTK